MGICSGKQGQSLQPPAMNPRVLRLQQQYAQVFEVTHSLNVNHKYSNYFTLIPDKFVGQGIKRTNQYNSRLCREEWLAKRNEFWESRLEGEVMYWNIIRKAVNEPDDTAARQLINSVELHLINDSIQLLFDNQGHKFDLPVFMINEPNSFPLEKSFDLNIIKEFSDEQLTVLIDVNQVKIRSSKLNQDLELNIRNAMKVSELKASILQMHPATSIRLFLNGKELHDHHLVGNYAVQSGIILQAFM